jgi:hypothetical protein
MNSMKKVIVLILVLSLLAVCFLACTSEQGSDPADPLNPPGESADSGERTPGEEPANPRDVPDDLPERDFGGANFRIYTHGEFLDGGRFNFAPETVSGDVINDSVYMRNRTVEDRFNTNIMLVDSGANGDNWDHVNTHFRNVILAGEDLFDIAFVHCVFGANLTLQGFAHNLLEVPHFNFDKPWWYKNTNEEMTVMGQMYMGSNAIFYSGIAQTWALYVNKDLVADLGLTMPYQDVFDGTWTIDKLMELTRGVNLDINGDGVMDQDDQWGLMSEWENAMHMLAAAGERTVSLNNDGIPEITMVNPRSINVIQKVLEICTDGVSMFHADTIKFSGNIWYRASEFFQENRFLMRTSVLEPVVRDLRAMPTDFGILPYTKFDEQQENYYSNVKGDGHFIAIPGNADLDFAGLMTEALAYESSTTLMPAFYDLCLTSKILRDDESEGMLDIIFNNRVYDIGILYNIGALPSLLYTLSQTKSTDFISRFEKSEAQNERDLNKLIEAYGR